jgi:hypothetical protein
VVPTFTAPEGSRLAQLLVEFDKFKPVFDQADKHMEEIKDAIKAELTQAAGQVNQGTLPAKIRAVFGNIRVLSSWRTRTNVNGKRLKADHPQIFAAYSSETGYWQLSVEK